MAVTNNSTLLTLSCKVVATFRPEVRGVDEHLGAFLRSQECKDVDEDGATFVREVFGGCIRYEALIKVVIDGFYSSDGKNQLNSDRSMYTVLCYLLMFRLEEMGVAMFKQLVNSQHTGNMYKFLNFFFADSNLNGWIKNEWYKVFDSTFVNTNILEPLARLRGAMMDYVDILEARVNNQLSSIKKKQPTESKPFKLTQPKPRPIPPPEKIPMMKPHKLVPRSTYVTPLESEIVAQTREAQKVRAEEKLLEAERMKFACANTEKSIKTKSIMKQIIEEREKELEFDPIHPIPLPTSLREHQPIKLNTAAILREGAIVQKAEEEEEKRLSCLEAGERDDVEFQKWKEEMVMKDAAHQEAEIKRKHLEAQLSYEEAILAYQNHIQEKREKVVQMKEESEKLLGEYFSRREEEKKEMRRLVEIVMQGHHNSQEARNKLQQMKAKIVQQVEQEKKLLMAKVLEEAEEEMHRKVELVRQIRAMESVPILRTKFVDLAESSGQGLLVEMSIAELRERLAMLKVAEEREKLKKKSEISVAKEAKEQLISRTLDNISRHRVEQNARQEKQKVLPSRPIKLDDNQKLTDLEQRLIEKRKEKERAKQQSLTSGKTAARTQSLTTKPNSTSSVMDTLLRTTAANNAIFTSQS